jgi:hypothetical protein
MAVQGRGAKGGAYRAHVRKPADFDAYACLRAVGRRRRIAVGRPREPRAINGTPLVATAYGCSARYSRRSFLPALVRLNARRALAYDGAGDVTKDRPRPNGRPPPAAARQFSERASMRSAQLLKSVFDIDRPERPNCGGELMIIAGILEAPIIEPISSTSGCGAGAAEGTGPCLDVAGGLTGFSFRRPSIPTPGTSGVRPSLAHGREGPLPTRPGTGADQHPSRGPCDVGRHRTRQTSSAGRRHRRRARWRSPQRDRRHRASAAALQQELAFVELRHRDGWPSRAFDLVGWPSK